VNPFTVLGLPEWPDLDDETIRAAWNQIAAQTSPARPDGGDLARYAQASAAFAQLNTAQGRSQAYADLAGPARADSGFDDDLPDSFGDDDWPGDELVPVMVVPVVFVPGPVPLRGVARMIAEIPSRFRRGHPWRLLARAAVVAGLCLAAVTVFPGRAIAAYVVAVLIVLFVLSAHEDMEPPAAR
jgi:hypothetical protein